MTHISQEEMTQRAPADTVDGDQILVGDIAESKNIAIGKDIQQTIYEGYSAEEVALIVAETRKADDAAPSVEIPPPPEPTKPPEVLGFVGRDEELTYFAEMLRTENLAVIAGMAGVGKTALASTLIGDVMREPSRVLWHSFHEGEGVDAVLWNLAGFLAWHGKDDLWKLLQSARLTGGQPPPPETIFDYILQLVRDGNYLLCFDDFHHVDDDPVLNQLIERLREALNAGHLSAIITSRRVPEFVTISQVDPVDGLTAQDTQRLLQTKGVALTQEQSDQLYASTAGNAEFLILAIDALQNARDPEDLLEQLAATDDIERYLISEVDDALTGQERGVMNALAALLGYAATRDAVEAVVDRGNVFRTLRGLSERHLLIVQETDAGRTYRQHDLVREFYYEMCSRRERKKLHARAGEFYRDDEDDLLQAGIHYERAGEVEEAARLATEDVWGVINRGRARRLSSLLELLDEGKLMTATQVEVLIAQGAVYGNLRKEDLAKQSFSEALNEIDKLAENTAILQARVYSGMGELLRPSAPAEALEWLQRGIDIVPNEGWLLRAELLIALGSIQIYLGQYSESSEMLNLGLSLLPETPSQQRCEALMNLGTIEFNAGNLNSAIDFAHQALSLSEQLHDQNRTVKLLGNLGNAKSDSGLLKDAADDYQRGLMIAQELNNSELIAALELNLGMTLTRMGSFEKAEELLKHALALSRDSDLKVLELFLLLNLGDLYVICGELLEAELLLLEADELAQELEFYAVLPIQRTTLSQCTHKKGELKAALIFAQEALSFAEEFDEKSAKCITMRVLGEIYLDLGQIGSAQHILEKSLQLSRDIGEPYSTARTNMSLARTIAVNNVTEEARDLLNEAVDTFKRMGAKYDLMQTQNFLQGEKDT